jgi:Eukaryotic elongation factor 5A hypusine, DNA-binding OB fold
LNDSQVLDLSEDGFFSMMSEDGATRDDLKLTENCNPTSPDAIRELLSNAEAAGERVIVCCLVLLNRVLCYESLKTDKS